MSGRQFTDEDYDTLNRPAPRLLPEPPRFSRSLILGIVVFGGIVVLLGIIVRQLASSGEASPGAPPRISLAAFKVLYDNPAKRPLILDVRAADQYAVGHISGAQSFPESELNLRVTALPRDRVIVTYCQ